MHYEEDLSDFVERIISLSDPSNWIVLLDSPQGNHLKDYDNTINVVVSIQNLLSFSADEVEIIIHLEKDLKVRRLGVHFDVMLLHKEVVMNF